MSQSSWLRYDSLEVATGLLLSGAEAISLGRATVRQLVLPSACARRMTRSFAGRGSRLMAGFGAWFDRGQPAISSAAIMAVLAM